MSVYARPHLLSSPPRRGNSFRLLLVLRMSVRPSQSDKFSKERRTILPLLGGEGREGGCHPCIPEVVAASEESGFTPFHPLKTSKNLVFTLNRGWTKPEPQTNMNPVRGLTHGVAQKSEPGHSRWSF